MPIVPCYQHPRDKHDIYSLEDKHVYVNALTLEALRNRRDRFFEDYHLLKEKVAHLDFPNVASVVDAMNVYKRLIFKEILFSEIVDSEMIPAWRSACFDKPFVVCDEIDYFSISHHDNTVVIDLCVEDLGFLEPLFCRGALTATLGCNVYLFDIAGVILSFENQTTLSIKTNNEYIVSLFKQYELSMKTFAEVSGIKVSEVGLGFYSSDIDELYGPIGIY